MDSVFKRGVDDKFTSARNSWQRIQSAWSGGVCVGNELFVWGGGHTDGAHNGLLAVNVLNGKWRRVTEPSPIWTSALCPDGKCKSVAGNCALGECTVGPDGRPVARHTYYLLTTDGQALYSVGGSIWKKGTAGDGPTTWKFDLATGKWQSLPGRSPVLKSHGSAVLVGDRIYHMTGHGFAIMKTDTGAWSVAGSLSGRGGGTGLVYVPTLDRIYAFGDGEAWFVKRSEWGKSMNKIPGAPSIVSQKGVGITYAPNAGLILLWDGGRKIVTLDPRTNKWGELLPAGDPGTAADTGTYGRFNYCSGRAVAVNGSGTDLFYVDLGGPIEPSPPTPPPVTPPPVTPPPVTPPPPTPPPVTPPPPTSPPPPTAPPPSGKVTPAPYYAEPPKDQLVRAQCGPESEWQIMDVTTTADAENVKNLISSDTRAVVRVHWRPKPYPVLRVDTARCVKFVGLPGPNGEKPLVGGVNATRAFRDNVRAGGVIIDNLEVSPGKIKSMDPTIKVADADCLGVPNDQMFFIVRNSSVTRCQHHAFITSHAHHMYVEIGKSFFAQASSHLAYIDHVAMAYVYDSAFESPGWGHALRCVGLRCRIERTKVSNVQLDGSVLPVGGSNPFQPKRVYIGMQPLEVYTCGENEVRDVEAVFRSDDKYNGRFAATVRHREAFRTCDVGEVVNGQWSRLKWGDPAFSNKGRWATVTPFLTKIERMKVTCVGPVPCTGWDVKGSYPVMDDAQKEELQKWLSASRFATWNDLLRAIPDTRPEWRWVASVTMPRHRENFLRGKITNKVPLPVPIPGWFQRTRVELTDVLVKGGGKIVRSDDEPRTYCYGKPPLADNSGNLLNKCSEQFDGAHFATGFVKFQ